MALLPTRVGFNRPDHRPATRLYLAKLSTLNRPWEYAMPAVNMLDAKTNLSRLVESLEQDSEREFIIARRGRPAARLVPLGNANPLHQRLGVAKGQFTVPDETATQNDEVARLFQGERTA